MHSCKDATAPPGTATPPSIGDLSDSENDFLSHQLIIDPLRARYHLTSAPIRLVQKKLDESSTSCNRASAPVRLPSFGIRGLCCQGPYNFRAASFTVHRREETRYMATLTTHDWPIEKHGMSKEEIAQVKYRSEPSQDVVLTLPLAATLYERLHILSFPCLHFVQHIGVLSDGSKWVHGMECIAKQEKCGIYSFSCEVWGFGPEIEYAPNMKERVHFFPCALGGRNAHGPDDSPKLYILYALRQLNGGPLPVASSHLTIELHAWDNYAKFDFFHDWWAALEAAVLDRGERELQCRRETKTGRAMFGNLKWLLVILRRCLWTQSLSPYLAGGRDVPCGSHTRTSGAPEMMPSTRIRHGEFESLITSVRVTVSGVVVAASAATTGFGRFASEFSVSAFLAILAHSFSRSTHDSDPTRPAIPQTSSAAPRIPMSPPRAGPAAPAAGFTMEGLRVRIGGLPLKARSGAVGDCLEDGVVMDGEVASGSVTQQADWSSHYKELWDDPTIEEAEANERERWIFVKDRNGALSLDKVTSLQSHFIIEREEAEKLKEAKRRFSSRIRDEQVARPKGQRSRMLNRGHGTYQATRRRTIDSGRSLVAKHSKEAVEAVMAKTQESAHVHIPAEDQKRAIGAAVATAVAAKEAELNRNTRLTSRNPSRTN
ncbi:hypothetical protein EDB89DRAFT_1906548 [Lactarius sanguifluus]|nr:hypothetical protein EDB89DRAFT_1906548 [Lactarius sanguifluus]